MTSKHLLALKDYWTAKKLANLARCFLEEHSLTARARAMPYTATIDVTNTCDLRCPGCPTGLGLYGREKTLLDLGHLESFLDQTGEYLLIAHLYNWGETLLHPGAASIVRTVHDRNIFTSISTHLSIRDPARLLDVCDAGLDHLIVSADGATAGSYQRYRRGGNFELVLENINRVVAHREKMKRKRPVIEWQILGFGHLEAEIEEAYRIASTIKVDMFTLRGAMAPEEWQPTDKKKRGAFYGNRERCGLLWHNITLQSDGGLSPCCFTYHKEDDFGHIAQGPVRDTRNNLRFRSGRNLFNRRMKVEVEDRHPCLRCPVVHRQAHLQGFLSDRRDAVHDPGFMSIVSGEREIEKIKESF